MKKGNICVVFLIIWANCIHSQSKLTTKIYLKDLENNPIPFANLTIKLNGASNTYTFNMDGEISLKYNYKDSCLVNIKYYGFLPLDTLFLVSKEVKTITFFLKEDTNVHLLLKKM